MITDFEQLSAMTSLLTNEELNALAKKCKNLIEDRKRIEREEFRQKLKENLQKAINDIIYDNSCALHIINESINDDDEGYYILLDPGNVYNIKIEE